MYKFARQEQENKHNLLTSLLIMGVIISCLIALTIYLVFSHFDYPEERLILSSTFPIFMFPFSFYIYLLSKKGKTILGLKIYLFITSFLISLAAFLFHGAYSASNILFIWVVVTSSILIKPKYALYSSIIFSSYIVLLAILQYNNIYTPYFIDSYKVTLILSKIYLVLVMLFAVGYFTYINISFLNKSRKELKDIAIHDPLTKLLNTFAFKESLAFRIDELRKNTKNDTKLALLFIDLDDFKDVNKRLGYEAGDQLLVDIANKFKKHLGDKYTIARFGGDVFILLIEYKFSTEILRKSILNEISNVFNAPYISEGHEFHITASIGASIYPENSSSVKELISNSYIALYKAKSKGRNRTEFYTLDLKDVITKKIDLKNKLRKAATNDELMLYYQPQVSIKSNKIVGAEALVRWKLKGRIISPNEFISIAEESGIIIELGEFVLRSACLDLRKWHKKGKKISLSVNISSQQFRTVNIVQKIEDIISETQIDPNYLELEITETDLLLQNYDIKSKINSLRSLGIKISIDDFGTGYSSLAYLKKFDINKIKIDKSFIWKLENNKEDKPIIQAIITMSKVLKLEVIAEGVETEYQKNFLKENNCEYYQGYLCSKPIPHEKFEELITKKGAV